MSAQYEEKFVVINVKYLNRFQLVKLSQVLGEFNLPNNNYYVCNQDEPYAGKVIQTILEGEDMKNQEWKQYKRKGLSEMIPYREGMDMEDVSISDADIDNGSPRPGDMIARNPKNHADKWLVAEKYFLENLELFD